MIWSRLLTWSRTLDMPDLSDEANRWADDEAERMPQPEDAGGWKASMAIAFEAGRMWERSRRAGVSDADESYEHPRDFGTSKALAVVSEAANGTSWPLPAMVHRLANAAQYLMASRDCDVHGWEGVTYAIGAARAFLEALPSGTVPVGVDGKPWMPAEGTCAGNPEDGPGNAIGLNEAPLNDYQSLLRDSLKWTGHVENDRFLKLRRALLESGFAVSPPLVNRTQETKTEDALLDAEEAMRRIRMLVDLNSLADKHRFIIALMEVLDATHAGLGKRTDTWHHEKATLEVQVRMLECLLMGPSKAVQVWAYASVVACDEAAPLSGDDYLIPAATMNAWREARKFFDTYVTSKKDPTP